MSVIDDRRPAASGTTSPYQPPPQLPDLEDAKQFYLFGPAAIAGSGVACIACGTGPGWWTYHQVPQVPVYYGFQPVSSNVDQLAHSLTKELVRLRALRQGWDGRNAKPITPEAIYGTILVLNALLDGNSEPPQFFPLSEGGIQVEWCGHDEVEIAIDGSGEAHVLATAENGDVIAEGILDPIGPSDLVATTAAIVKNLSASIAAERHKE